MRNVDREINLVEDNSGIQIELSCEDYDFGPIDLTGKSVSLFIKKASAPEATNSSHPECLVTAPLQGKAVYTIQSGDFPDPGTYFCDVEISGGTDRQIASEALRVIVRDANR